MLGLIMTTITISLALLMLGGMVWVMRAATRDEEQSGFVKDLLSIVTGGPKVELAQEEPAPGGDHAPDANDRNGQGKAPDSEADEHSFEESCPACKAIVTQHDEVCPSCGLRLQ
ncbi:zinc ribbon domain-containing protein [Paenibacillus turpanensis]|uniref:zinc ribbon domain-containing protein n=1 Tax=Paenibacillus turpanensis TaxID=2689078 RepID=UPI00140A55C1|nr:zinc ribbon domain-containing protein [Paenibacillus turpanensis]